MLGPCMELLLAWLCVGTYILFGGYTLREIELSTEIQVATDYCIKVDMLLNGLTPDQRTRFSVLLNKMVCDSTTKWT